ncbi:MAG: RDD family protein [Acidimicrobiales bacterium]
MSESQMQPGWYYAQGDAPGTQRYWDGTQWVGDPQMVGQAQDSLATATGAGVPAEYGQRVIAVLINFGIVIALVVVVAILAAIAGAINDGLGAAVTILGGLAYLGFYIWNEIIRMGQTGQSIGKAQQNIKLVSDDTGQPVGAGMAFVRVLVAWLLSTFTCGIGGFLDILWPLWDQDKKRLTDKILNMSVVKA